jgi:hypothetical protein
MLRVEKYAWKNQFGTFIGFVFRIIGILLKLCE